MEEFLLMDFYSFFKNFLIIFTELMLLFLVISFLVSWLQQIIPEEKIKNILSRPKGWKGYLYGTALGSITPFCSCSTIPILAGLLSTGAPFGPAMSFLIASPLLNPIIVVLLWSLFGWEWTLMYVVVMFIASMLIGMLWSNFKLERHLKNISVRRKRSTQEVVLSSKWRIAGRDAWSFFLNVLPHLFIGVLIGAVIYSYVPETFITKYASGQNMWAIPLSAIIGIPMYVRIETLFPISGALISNGMGLGAVAALIIGGAGASIPEVLLLSKLFKKKLLFAFLISIFSLAVITGLIAEFIF